MERESGSSGPGGPIEATALAGVNRSRRPLLRRWLVLAFTTVVFLFAAWGLPQVIGAEVGWHTALLATAVSFIPLGIVVPAFMWLDAYEAEPTRFLVLAFVWGAVIATATALVLNTGSMLILASTTADPEAVTAVTVAPIVEESLKGLGVLFILFLRRDEFDGVIDGIVYAGIVASGFAFAENILYFGRAFNEAGAEGMVAVFIVRGLVSPFAHPLFTTAFGIAVGFAVHRPSGLMRLLAPLAGLLVAIGLHSAWNFSSVAGAGGFWYSYLAFQVPVFVVAIAFAAWARYREGRLMGRYLQVYADYGWLSAAEVRMLTDLRERRTARKWARSVKGSAGSSAMQAFQDDAVELAMLRKRMGSGAAGPDAVDREKTLLDSIQRCRALLG
ncbi:MAG: PrsW family intramembrane metalloprotease [Dermatophilus congolensis]|nr:PrsW family intramembrane metalloprotease [Dermatophilus congolensis]